MCETRNSSKLGKITVLFVICCCCLPAHAKYGGGSGTLDYPYLIYDANNMQAIGADSNDWDKHFKLMADIDLDQFDGKDGRERFNLIAPDVNDAKYGFQGTRFTGVFDGNGHTIKNFSYTSTGTSYIGLFGYVAGENAEIKNLGLIDPNIDAGTGDYVGSLVGFQSRGSIHGCYVKDGTISGDWYSGGLVGYNFHGTITDCSSSASVSGDAQVGGLVGVNSGTITTCYATGSVGGDRFVGGLVGFNGGTITNCYSIGSVSGTGDYVGGLVGNNKGIITNCYSTGSVEGDWGVGGLVGENYEGSISNCYSTGDVNGNNRVGGLVGRNYKGSISNCYSTGSVEGVGSVGGLVAYNYAGEVTHSFWDTETSGLDWSDGGTGLLTDLMQMDVTFTDAGWDFIDERCNGTTETWQMPAGGGYPVLSFFHIDIPLHLAGSGTVSEPYLVNDANELGMVSWYPVGCYFKLTRDIDLSGINWSVSLVPVFNGCFDGDGHRVLNMQISGCDYLGLFGYLRSGGQVRNIALEGCYLIGTGQHVRYIGCLVGKNSGMITNSHSISSVEGRYQVGGLVGDNGDYGTISNCYSTGDVNGFVDVGGLVGFNGGIITDCYTNDSVTGGHRVGGLVGDNQYSSVSNCYSIGSVSGTGDHVGGLLGLNWGSIISNCSSSGYVSGENRVGGLVGDNNGYGRFSNCYSTASVFGADSIGGLVGYNAVDSSLSNCYSTGDVRGDDFVGGLVGENWNSVSVSNSYSTGSVSGNDYVGGLVGYNGTGDTITNCYAIGSVVIGRRYLGGLCGRNRGTITNCYSTSSVEGEWDVGGLVGWNNRSVWASFWDIETSGQATSAGGTGLLTDQMQMQITFTDAGWDFVGETVNGIEDIWFIPQEDYPHLWWEGMQVPMKLTPRTLNCRSKGNYVKAHITLPEGVTVEDVNSNRPAVLHSFGFQSAPLYVFVNKDKVVEIEAAFERESFCSLAGAWPEELTVAGFLTDGNIFLGTSTVRIIHPGMKVIEELAWQWLNGDCVHPDFCNDIDMNRDSIVNLLDYALLVNSEVEFVTDE